MNRNFVSNFEDAQGELQELTVEYEVSFNTNNVDDSIPYAIHLKNVLCNQMPYTLTEEEQFELLELCYEHFDDESWEYESD
jgi:hypothetical protein